MLDHMDEKIKHGRGTKVYAMRDDGGVRRLVLVGDFDAVRYHFNQMAALAGGQAMAQLLAAAHAPGAPAGLPTGAWTNRVSGNSVGLPADCYELAAYGPCDAADILGAMARFKDWPDGIETLPGTKHLCTSMSEVGDLFYASRDTYLVRVGRAQERSTVKRVEEAIKEVQRKGYSVSDEESLRAFMKHYAEAKYLQAIHTVETD
jgi:hypothetical protein